MAEAENMEEDMEVTVAAAEDVATVGTEVVVEL